MLCGSGRVRILRKVSDEDTLGVKHVPNHVSNSVNVPETALLNLAC